MNPSRVFAVLILLLAVALLVQGYLIPALFAAVFGVLVFAASHVQGGRSNDEGVIGDAGASLWPSSGSDGGHHSAGVNRVDNCETGDGGGESGGDGSGDCGGGD